MWFVYVIISSLFSALYYFGNQSAKISPNVFMFYRGIVPVIVLLPFLPLFPFIGAWQFYALCLLQGCVIAYIDNRNYQAMQKWGAEIISSLHPFSVGVVFVVWFLLKPAEGIQLISNPLKFIGVVVTLSCIVYATASFKKDADTKAALAYLLPFYLGAAVCDNINKLCMSYLTSEQVMAGSYYYILLTGAVIALFNFGLYLYRGGEVCHLYSMQNIKYSWVLLIGICCMVSKNFAMFSVSNPSYVTAALYLYIIWIMIGGQVLRYFGVNGTFKKVNRRKALLLLIAAVALILLEK